MFINLKCLFFATLISNNLFASFSTTNLATNVFRLNNLRAVTTRDIKSVRFLEDFYWAFRNQDSTWMRKSIDGFRPLSTELLIYKKVIKDGYKILAKLKHHNIINCSLIKSGFDHISTKYYSLYRATCISEKISLVLKSKHSLSKKEKSFLLNHDYILTKKIFRNHLLEKIEHAKIFDKTFYSNFIKHYIYNHKKLPSLKFMKHVIVDSRITRFIQKNELFDIHDKKFFTREFKKLISQFKVDFLEGDQESAADILKNAVKFYHRNQNEISNAKAWKLFFDNGISVARDEHSQDLALLLFKFSEKVAEDENLFDSKLQTLLTFYQSNQLSKALAFIKTNHFVKNFDHINSKLRFWSAYIYDKRNEKVIAKQLYLKQIALNPLSYYSILSLKQLRKINPSYTADAIVKPNSFSGIKHIVLTKKAVKEIQLFKIFSMAKSSFLTSLQGAELRKVSPKEFFAFTQQQTRSNHQNFLLSFFSSQGEYLLSFKQAYSSLKQGDIELTPNVLSSLFPTTYGNIIKSQKSPIDFRLILSLIRQESAFNKKAKSIVGARGLMQLMPQTARNFKRKLKSYQLFDPNLNISIGVKFLEKLVKRYNGNLMLTLSAYNAGMGNVSRWQKAIPFSKDILLNIELIPFNETRKYVKLIYRNLFFYKYIDQDPSHLNFALNESFQVSLQEK